MPKRRAGDTPPQVHANIEDMFQTLRQDLHTQRALLSDLQTFKDFIERGRTDGIFDQEDCDWVQSECQSVQSYISQRETELARKEELYKNSVQKLEQILLQRKDIIEAAEDQTHVLSQRPQLLEHFAKKRAHLMMLVDQGKKDLQM